jgi:hypothetical protein
MTSVIASPVSVDLASLVAAEIVRQHAHLK